MSDILDSIDDLVDEDEDFNTEIEEADEIHDASVDLDSVLENEGEMSETEAKEVTAAIRSAVTATYILLAQAHEGKAYKALGYETWAEYVKEEFEISPQRSYQLLDLSKTIKMIEEVSPEGTNIKLTEAQARDIKRELPKITEQIKEETKDLDPEEAEDHVGRIIEDARQQQKEDEAGIAQREKNLAEAEKEGYQKGLEAAADAMLDEDDENQSNSSTFNADAPNNMTSSADDEFLEVDVQGDGEGISPSDNMNLYQFVNALTGISSLPEPDDFVDVIPESRFDELYEQVLESASWINRISTLMELKKN